MIRPIQCTMDTILSLSKCKIDDQAFTRYKNWRELYTAHARPFPKLIEIHEIKKVVYIARNPKDVAVSCYHFKRLVQAFGYTGDFASYWDYFEKNQLPWAPYWAHINEGWKRRHQPNVLFLFYEDINKDLPGTVRKVAQFLNKSLSEEQVAQMSKHLNIENFRRNPAVNMDFLKEVGLLNSGEQSFIRKGGVGGWTSEFTPELNQRADRWIHEHLKNTDIRFPSTN
uniref:Sulfotransferase domain-containing protein n=1 Tax=Timema shepardi TaxID=629360 RepID=A0A7R9B1R9_TIMSH|nr:unnamed protein product [Timema shepardi]